MENKMPESVVSITPLSLPGKIRYSLFLLTVLFIAAAGSAASLNLAQAQLANGVYDTDGDRLIEISNLQQLHFIRYDPNGDGSADDSSNDASYALGFPLSGNQSVCDRPCRGYELTRSLDFDDGNSYLSGDVNTAWTGGAGWQPIQEFKATFDGNGHTISNLYMDVARQQSQSYAGLFGSISGYSADSPAVIEDIGLLNVEVTGVYNVGGLVGSISSIAQVSRSYVTGAVSGTGSHIGGLVGYSTGEISESYSTAAVEDTDRATAESAVGGLVGYSNGEITESYATGQSTGYRNVGGLAGVSFGSSRDPGLIHSSYATGRVTGGSRVGGLVGIGGQQTQYPSRYSTITDSYAIGAVAGDEDTGGLLGYGGSGYTTINNSYWNTDVSATGVGGGGALGAAGRPTAELQRPTGRTGFYSLWTSPNWDFGNSSQYPVLKADLDGDGTATAAEFGGQGRVAPAPQSLPGSAAIVSVSPGVGSLTVYWRAPSSNAAGIAAYDLRHILTDADETVDANWTVADNAWTGSGPLQYVITGLTGGAPYDLQVRAVNSAGNGPWSLTTTGTPHLNLAQAQLANGVYDTDGDRLIEISNLQQLHFIRYDPNGDGSADDSSNDASYALGFPLSGNQSVCDRPCRGYELTRSLDFDDGNSYLSGDVNTAWTGGAGWQPIQEFKATFDGNGHTISNLYMDVARQQSQSYAGLFGSISGYSADSPAVIEDIGLLNVEVTGVYNVGGLVGSISSIAQVSRSYVTGAVSGTGSHIGGLVGYSTGEISESYSTAAVEDTDRATAESAVGGLVGYSNGEITESYATGQSTGYRNVGGLAGVSFGSSRDPGLIHSSYATGRVTGGSRVGGLVGIGGQQTQYPSRYSTITDSYAIGAVAGDEDTGGLLGYGGSGYTTINNSYWNTDVSATGVGGGGALGAAGRPTAELQRPTGRTGFYSLWTSPNWDFGNSSQYPVLKADLDGDGTATAAEFGGQGRVAPAPQSLPGSAAIVSVSPGVGSLTVYWRAPSSNAAGIAAYDLRHILTDADETVDANWTVADNAWTGSGPLQYVITGLTGGAPYDLQVRAVNSAGNGPWSLTTTGTPHLNLAQAQLANGVYDTDGDRLIEISNLQQLHFIRYDPNGDGSADDSSNDASYALGFPLSGNQSVCDRPCRGYELTRSLDFDDGNSYLSGDVNTAWTGGAGWQPIQEFKATFDGNGHTISNLYMDVARQQSQSYAGLFGSISGYSADSPAVIEDIGLLNVEVTGVYNVGGLVGSISSIAQVSRSYVTGAVSGTGSHIGGLVGYSTGEISESYSTAAVEDTDRATAESAVGGLVGYSNGEITESYATGQSTGYRNVGGLAGVSFGSSRDPGLIHSSYATGRVTGGSRVGGLVGIGGQQTQYPSRYSTITDSYAIGAVAGDEDTGGLLGYGGSGYTTINNSYWNTDVSATGVGGGGALGAAGRPTAELQRPTGRTGFYSLWTSPNWDFGNSSQYPVLKADLDGDGTATAAEFGGQGRVAPAPQSLPGSAAIVSVSPGVGSLTVYWRAPSSNAAGIAAYDLRHILTDADETVDANWTVADNAWTGSGPLQYVITGLTGGAPYDLQVRAVNSAGNGPWSLTTTGTPQTDAPVMVGSVPMVELSIDDSQPRMIRIGSPVPVIATFTEAVSGFTVDDITVVNGTVGNFVADAGGMVYTFDVTPDAIAEVTVDMASGLAMDAHDNGNTAAAQLSFTPYDDDGVAGISRAETIAAIRDYFSGNLDRAQAIAVIRLYFASGN